MPTLTLEQKQALKNDFINRSLRDIADQDYVAARILHKAGLYNQFLWMAHQAIEKYLKAILAYSGIDTRDLGHHISKAYQRVRTISDIPFDFPKEVEDFIAYLNEEGPNRYFEYPTVRHGKEISLLDASVWYIRRFCFNTRVQLQKPSGSEVDLFPLEIRRIQAYPTSKAHRFRLFGGFLERVLDEKGSYIRRELVWKNFYYGSYTKRVVRNVRLGSGSANPTHYLYPEIFEDLDKIIQFSKPVREYFEKLKSSQRGIDEER
jgi:HEPN domain-containing protein